MLELVKEITDETKISKINVKFYKTNSSFEDIQNIFQNVKYIYKRIIKHTPMDTFIKNIYISYGSCFVKERKLNVSFILYLCH